MAGAVTLAVLVVFSDCMALLGVNVGIVVNSGIVVNGSRRFWGR